MKVQKSGLKRWGKRLLILLTGLLLLSLISFFIAWHVLRTDHSYVISKLQEKVAEKWPAQLGLEGYELKWSSPWPLIELQIRGVQIARSDYPAQPALRFNFASTEFHPWNLLTGNFEARPLFIDSLWLHIQKDTLGRTNLFFKDDPKQAGNRPVRPSKPLEIAKLPTLTLNYFDLHLEDIPGRKWQHVDMHPAQIKPIQDPDGDWKIQLLSDAHFYGLMFKEADGAFLKDTDGQLDLNIAFSEDGREIIFKQSALKVDQDVFNLAGRLVRADTNHLQFNVSHAGVLIHRVAPLLSNKIQIALNKISIDQPVEASFVFNKAMVPGRKASIQTYFATDSARIQIQNAYATDAKLIGNFSNDCDLDGVGQKGSGCVTIDQLNGRVLGLIPIDVRGRITQLKDPMVDANGRAEIILPELNPMFGEKGKATFVDGTAVVEFVYGGRLKEILEAPFDDRHDMQGKTVFENIQLELDKRQEPLPALSGRLSFDQSGTFLENIDLNWRGTNILISGELNNLPEFIFYDKASFESDLTVQLDHLNLGGKSKGDKKNTSTKIPDQSRIMRLARRVASNINGNIYLLINRISTDDVFVTDLSTTIQFYSPYKKSYADSVLIQLQDLKANYEGKYPLHATIGLDRDSLNSVLLNLVVPQVGPVARKWLPDNLKVLNGDVSLQLNGASPLAGLLSKKKILETLTYQGQLLFDDLDLEVKNFTWPVRKISGPLSFDGKRITFDSLHFKYEGAPLLLNGYVDNYAVYKKSSDEKAYLDLDFSGRYIDRRKKVDTQPKEKQPMPSPATLFKSLDKVLKYGRGRVSVRLDSLMTNSNIFRYVLLDLRILPGEEILDDYRVMLDSFKFNFGPRDLVRGSAKIYDPSEPKLDARILARMTLPRMAGLLKSDYIEYRDGYFNLDLDYHSPLYDTLNAANYLLKADLDGKAEIVNGGIFYNYRDFYFDNIYGHFEFDEQSFYIRDLDMEINDNRLFVDGFSENFFPFFILPDRDVNLEINVASPRFNFGMFQAPEALGKDSLAAVAEVVDTTEGNGFIDRLLNRGALHMNLDFDTLKYKKFAAYNILGGVNLKPDSVRMDSLRMELANGKLAVNGLINGVVAHQPHVDLDLNFEEHDLQEIFRQFDSFGQTQLAADNIRGWASAKLDVVADFDANYSVVPGSIYGDVLFTFAGGELINLPALKNKKGFLFNKRRLEHILLDTIDLFASVRGNKVYFNQFDLHSSAFGLGVIGTLDLVNKADTRLLIGLPVSNLYRRHIKPDKLNRWTTRRKGLKIYIEAHNKNDRMRLKWRVPFSRKPYVMPQDTLGTN